MQEIKTCEQKTKQRMKEITARVQECVELVEESKENRQKNKTRKQKTKQRMKENTKRVQECNERVEESK